MIQNKTVSGGGDDPLGPRRQLLPSRGRQPSQRMRSERSGRDHPVSRSDRRIGVGTSGAPSEPSRRPGPWDKCRPDGGIGLAARRSGRASVAWKAPGPAGFGKDRAAWRSSVLSDLGAVPRIMAFAGVERCSACRLRKRKPDAGRKRLTQNLRLIHIPLLCLGN